MGKIIKIFGEKLDQGALDQFYSAMNQPFAVRGALLPDAHVGYSLPIGAVVATEGIILPSWVGYDIGCGMTYSGACTGPCPPVLRITRGRSRGIMKKTP